MLSKNDNAKKSYIHISFDDVIETFYDLNANRFYYESIFDNSFLFYLRELNCRYGAKFSLFCMYECSDFSLNKCTSKFRSEFKSNASWLRFGFHARNIMSSYKKSNELAKDYNDTMEELERIVGIEALDFFPRIHSFQGEDYEISSMKKNSKYHLIGLYTADDNRMQYNFSRNFNVEIADKKYIKKQSLAYLKSSFRFEKIIKFPYYIVLTIFNNGGGSSIYS